VLTRSRWPMLSPIICVTVVHVSLCVWLFFCRLIFINGQWINSGIFSVVRVPRSFDLVMTSKCILLNVSPGYLCVLARLADVMQRSRWGRTNVWGGSMADRRWRVQTVLVSRHIQIALVPACQLATTPATTTTTVNLIAGCWPSLNESSAAYALSCLRMLYAHMQWRYIRSTYVQQFGWGKNDLLDTNRMPWCFLLVVYNAIQVGPDIRKTIILLPVMK